MSDKPGRNRRTATGTPAAPYGFRFLEDGHTIRIDSDEQSVIGLIDKMKRQGKTYAAIAKQLNAKGITGRDGKPWDGRNVRRVMTDDSFDFSLYGSAPVGRPLGGKPPE
ncbi:MAG: recombinase family protein [Burkholderiales bacterium]